MLEQWRVRKLENGQKEWVHSKTRVVLRPIADNRWLCKNPGTVPNKQEVRAKSVEAALRNAGVERLLYHWGCPKSSDWFFSVVMMPNGKPAK